METTTRDGRPPVLIINGASSSGKTTLARLLQSVLPGTWLVLGLDTISSGLPESVVDPAVEPDPMNASDVVRYFPALESGVRTLVAHLVTRGVPVIVDSVLQDGARDQERWRSAMPGRAVFIGLSTPLEVMRARARARPDRAPGLADVQHGPVHDGVTYDAVVDTTRPWSGAEDPRIRHLTRVVAEATGPPLSGTDPASSPTQLCEGARRE